MAQDEQDIDENSISKSERKRRMLALQGVGEELVALSHDALKKFDLPESLREAILDAKRINPNKHGGMNRQMQFIGKIMREVDAAPIIQQLEELRAPSREQTALHHLAEKWRDQLLADHSAVGAFVAEFVEADTRELAREQLAKMIAATVEERKKHGPPKHFRLLYKTLHLTVVKAAKLAKTNEDTA